MSKIDDAIKRVNDLVKAYNPDQPRDPGGEGGGQWISDGGGTDDKKVAYKPKGKQPADAPLNSRGEPVYDNSEFKYDDNAEDAASTQSIKDTAAGTLKLFQYKVKQKVKSGAEDAEYWQAQLDEAKGWYKNLAGARNKTSAGKAYEALLASTEGINQ
jgi:hypothetical protein